MNHRPTDAAIKSSVMLALGSSIFPPYSILAQRYRQNDHANKTWTDLRMDIDTGTSRDSDIHMRQRDRTFREWRNSPSRFDQPPTESRSSRTLYDNYHSDGRKRANDQPNNQPHHPQDVRAATPTSQANTPTQLYPCANCSGDHRATECDSTKCFTCQANFPTAALRQAHYLATHKRDSTVKRARFAPISAPPRSQYTPPSSPFLSRSAAEMQNPSPYDSGYDSSFSTASGPGRPPSSHGNSDIDDQVDRYIRDQRVATIVHTTSVPALPTSTTPNNTNIRTRTHTRPLEPLPLHITRAIADYNHALANDPNFDEPPPLIPDSDDDDDSDDADTDSPLTPRTEDTHAATRSSPYPPTHITTLPTLTDDAQKQLRRPYPFGLSHQPHRTTQDHIVIFDARAATTQDSDSSSNHPDHIDSDEDYPGYWPERRESPPPRTNSPPVSTISDTQLADWTRSQLPWHTFRHRIPELRNIPDALCGPPHIPRLYPPHQYMLAHQHGTPDQLGVNDRTSHFYNPPNNDTWSQYLVTLPPMVRRYYNTLPPSLYDYPLHTSTSNKHKAPRLGGYSRSSDPTSNQPRAHKRQRTTPPNQRQ